MKGRRLLLGPEHPDTLVAVGGALGSVLCYTGAPFRGGASVEGGRGEADNALRRWEVPAISGNVQEGGHDGQHASAEMDGSATAAAATALCCSAASRSRPG